MQPLLDRTLAESGGVAGRAELVRVLGRARFDNEVRRGRLVAVFPRAYCRPWDADLPTLRARAALTTVGGEVALSHTTALGRWDLPVPENEPLHVTAYQPRHPRGVPGELVVHRSLCPLQARYCDGMPTVAPELAIATSWPLLSGAEQRAPAITAVRRRLVSASALARTVESVWWVRGRRQLRDFAGLLLSGCESELELWGYLTVFAIPELSDATRQLRVRAGSKAFRVDMAYEAERLAVELDGRAYHAGTEQWERDIARDLLLATVGWQTIRLSHARLTNDVAGCRRDVLAVRAARRRGVS